MDLSKIYLRAKSIDATVNLATANLFSCHWKVVILEETLKWERERERGQIRDEIGIAIVPVFLVYRVERA